MRTKKFIQIKGEKIWQFAIGLLNGVTFSFNPSTSCKNVTTLKNTHEDVKKTSKTSVLNFERSLDNTKRHENRQTIVYQKRQPLKSVDYPKNSQ